MVVTVSTQHFPKNIFVDFVNAVLIEGGVFVQMNTDDVGCVLVLEAYNAFLLPIYCFKESKHFLSMQTDVFVYCICYCMYDKWLIDCIGCNNCEHWV